ncbi:hypothetical protein OKW21_000280 [Catalinimonas alkaloidigena]|uniref:hypothetical protein n=1 Tax=Catalinimonas alkaloidigena TaxID=1075417 RepID=UPI0024061FB2|nr:hypothetical protein [Catalinimonas alkaloidigena]MDF9795017.1 hypothetical protein [Catalinimonas alkaloidigena]
MSLFKTYFLSFMPFLLCTLPMFAQGGNGYGQGSPFTFFPQTYQAGLSKYYPTSLYLEPGMGAGVWYQSDQLNMEPQRLPLVTFLEVSKDLSPLSYGISYNTFTSFRQRDFVLNPEYASLYARYSFSQLFSFVPLQIDAFVMAGATAWQAELRDERAPEFRSAEPIETERGAGWMAGAGVRYYLKNLGLGAQWNYYNAQASFLAGADELVEVAVGSAQLQLTLSYRFRLSDPIQCPTFR